MATIIVTVSGSIVMVGNGDTVIIDIPGGGDVTIIADPSVKVKNFSVKFVGDTEADSVSIALGTFSEKNLQIDIHDYDPSDSLSLVGATNTQVGSAKSHYEFDYVGADGKTYTGFVRANDTGEKDFTASPAPIIICFAAGTMISTSLGPKKVEDLKEWDCVRTVDHGLQPVRWIGKMHLSKSELQAWPHLRPVRVERHALGPGSPERPLFLSPNHRVLATGWAVQLMFGVDEVLVPIKSLINGKSIAVDTTIEEIDYYHILLEGHELIYADGAIAETLLLADQSRKAIGTAEAELEILFEDLVDEGFDSSQEMVRPALKMREATLLAAA